MDHAEAMERIEIAAAEPDGLERLMAGDTPDSAAVAGHLAGCPDCAAQVAPIRRTSMAVREVLSTMPDPALRDRTLAFVRAVGRDRGAAATAGAPAPVAGAEVRPFPGAAHRARLGAGRSWMGWAAGIAAAAVLAAALGFAAGGADRDGRLTAQADEIGILTRATAATLRVERQPDARHVALVGGDPAVTGTLLFSPSSGELVAMASGLPAPPAGQEYGCWFEVDGHRQRVGRMYPGGDLASWAGPVAGLATLPAGATFGVSLVPIGGGGNAPPLLTGEL